MRNTLIIGLLLCLPTVVLLALVSLAVLIGTLREARPGRCSDLPMAEPDREKLRDAVDPLSPAPAGRLSAYPGQVLTALAHAGPRAQGDELLGLRPVIADWCHREDEPALAQADRLDQDRAAGPGQDDHVTGVDVASKDQILHR